MSTVVITGANRGIGLELTRQLLDQGRSVIAACRQVSAELAASGARVVEGVDVAQAAGVATLSRAVQEPIALLINNAGVLTRESLDALNLDQIRCQFEVNALAPLAVTHALLDRLDAGSTVAVVTSRMGSLADNTSGARYGYRMSKAAANMMAVSLSRDLAPRGIAVAILHPGFVRTGMTGFSGYIEADEAARGLLQRIAEAEPGEEPVFRHASGEVLPW